MCSTQLRRLLNPSNSRKTTWLPRHRKMKLGDLVVGGFVERKLASHEFTVSLSFLGKLLIKNEGDSIAVFSAIEKRYVML